MFGEIYFVKIIKIRFISCGKITGIPRLVFALWGFADTAFFFTNGRFVATLHRASLLVPFYQQHLWACVSVLHLVILTKFQGFSLLLYVLCWCVIRDLWCLIFGLGAMKHAHTRQSIPSTNVVCILIAPLIGHSPVSPSPQVSLFPETQQSWN